MRQTLKIPIGESLSGFLMLMRKGGNAYLWKIGAHPGALE